MKSTLLTYIDRFRQNRRERLVLGSVLLFLAVIVSLIVYWQLRYTGITMSNETFCGYEEHVHTEECYDEEGNLVCELEEHSHTVDCLINLNADVEDATVWKATLPELTGDLRTDVVNIAYSQLGYTESTANFSPGEDGVTRYGYTRYGAWYGNEYGTWDAMFVSFCLNYAGIDRTAFPLNSGAYSWAVELSEIGSYAEASAYTPLAGDIVFFDTDLDGRIDRVGIAVSVDEFSIAVIEGDYTAEESDIVALNTYPIDDLTISGYGIIAVSEEAEEETEEAETEETDDETEDTEESEEIEIEETEDTEETEEETEESPTLFYTASDSGVNVTVIAPEGALPDGATLAVTLLDEESDEYAEAAEAVGYEDSEDTGMAALDITFYDEFGFEVEPALPVTVTVDITEIIPEGTTADTIEVTHITDTEVNPVEPLVETVTDTTDETAVVVFETESFSTFTLTWYTHSSGQGWNQQNYGATITVNIYSSDDGGQTYTLASDSTSYSLGTNTSNTSTLYIDNITSAVTGLDGYEYYYSTVVYRNTTYGSSTDSVTSITSSCYSQGDRQKTYYYTPVIYTQSNTYNNLQATQTTNGNENVTFYTINIYYIKSSASITINKYETGDTTYTQLSGATFTLTLSDSTETLEGIGYSGISSVTYSNDNKTITFTTEGSAIKFTNLPDGTYTLTETSAPSGYEMADAFEFTVEDNVISSNDSRYSSGTVTIEDDPETTTLTISKSYNALTVDDVSTLQATFSLTATDTTCTYDDVTITGESTGVFNIHLHDGTYTLTESSVPSDFDTPAEITITVIDGVIYVDGEESSTVSITNTQTATLTITDNLISNGTYEATMTVGGTTIDLTDSRYTVTWYKSDYTLSADLSTCTNNENYSEVTNSDALGENNTTVNVAIDGGGLCYYYVTVTDTVTGETYSTLTYQVEHVPYAAELMNCSFEYPTTSGNSSQLEMANVPFWSTTTDGGLIEIGKYSAGSATYGTNTSTSGGAETGIYAGGSQEAAGDQFAELNAKYSGALYQDVLTIGGESLNWAFYHRARTADGGSGYSGNRTDTMYVVIMSAEDAEKLLADVSQSDQQSVLNAMVTYVLNNGSSTEGTDGTAGTYTLVYDNDYQGDTVSATIWTVSSTNSYQTGTWSYNSGTYTVPEGQYVSRFFFVSGTTSSGDTSVGNLIDYATFSQDITYVIEYWTRTENDGPYTLVKTTTGSEYPYTNVYADISTYTAAGYGLVGSVTGTASGGSYPADYTSSGTYSSAYTSMFDQYTTTGMRVNSGTMYLSVYLSMPVVTVIKQVSGLSESQLDAVLDEGDYEVDFTIVDNDTGDETILTVHVGSTGIGSDYTIDLSVDHTYTITEVVNHTGSYLDDYEMTVTVSGAETTNALGAYTFTVVEEESITITFTNTYAEVVTGGPEMPQTGGRGTKLYTMVGLLLICSGGYLLYRKQRRKCKWRWNI